MVGARLDCDAIASLNVIRLVRLVILDSARNWPACPLIHFTTKVMALKKFDLLNISRFLEASNTISQFSWRIMDRLLLGISSELE